MENSLKYHPRNASSLQRYCFNATLMVLSSYNHQWWLQTQEEDNAGRRGRGGAQAHTPYSLQPRLWCQVLSWAQNLSSSALSRLINTTGTVTPSSLLQVSALTHSQACTGCLLQGIKHGAWLPVPSKNAFHAIHVPSIVQFSNFQLLSLFLIFQWENWRIPGHAYHVQMLISYRNLCLQELPIYWGKEALIS